jgi:hypothetical protein
MLHEGRMQIQNAKKVVEGAIEDVQELKGLWNWLLGLFNPGRSKSTTPQSLAQTPTKTTRKKKSYEELELELIQSVAKQLGEFFDLEKQIKDHYAELELKSKTEYDPDQNTSKAAIDRALIEMQIEDLSVQIREAMVYAPKELKDIYSRFLKMHKKILEEQAFARKEKIRKANFERWQREQKEEKQFYRLMTAFLVFILILWFWGIMLALKWQRTMMENFW